MLLYHKLNITLACQISYFHIESSKLQVTDDPYTSKQAYSKAQLKVKRAMPRSAAKYVKCVQGLVHRATLNKNQELKAPGVVESPHTKLNILNK